MSDMQWETADMKDSFLIGIGGLLRSGKDTVADYLVENYGFVKMGMSEPLNDAMLTLNPWIMLDKDVWAHEMDDTPWWKVGQVVRYQALHETKGYTIAKEQTEVREFLQLLGTDVGRKMISETVWLDIARRNALKHLNEGHSVILTGMRFPNELEMIVAAGGTTVWVDRPMVYPGGGLVPTTAQARHDSENSVKEENFDHTIKNDGSLDALYYLTDQMIAYLTVHGPIWNASATAVQVDNAWPNYDH